MRPRREIGEKEMQELREAMEAQKNLCFRRRLQCVWLRAAHDMSTESIAKATGLTEGYIWKLWSRYFRGGLPAVLGKPQGGRRRQNMTRQEEAKLLEEFRKEAVAGRLVVSRKIKSEYAKRVGHLVPDSTISRVLARHNWRLVKPRPKHPKSSPEAREDFKKNSARKWLPPGLPSRRYVCG